MRIIKPYLMGQITKDRITYQWRADLRHYVETLEPEIRECIDLIDPCGNPFSMRMLEEVHGIKSEIPFSENVVSNGQSFLFPAIDKAYVKKSSNCGIVNLNHYTPTTPFIGSIFEIAWYHDCSEKPLVGVFEGDPTKDYLCSHPFVTDTIHYWTQTPREALDLLISLRRI